MAAHRIIPQLGSNSFNCPHCGAQAHQSWFKAFLKAYPSQESPTVIHFEILNTIYAEDFEDDKERERFEGFRQRLEKHFITYRAHLYGQTLHSELINVTLSHCFSCDGFAVWSRDQLIHPVHNSDIVSHAEMPENIKEEFQEAADIVDRSPRGAAALLRLCIQRLMPHIGGKGENLNHDIGKLVGEGLEPEIQQAMDLWRVIGNNAVHPGQIDLQDDKATALSLFELLNLIVERKVAVPNRLKALYATLPQSAREQIERRNVKQQDNK
jgi:hypothetical protein